jgi:hypothetical protein
VMAADTRERMIEDHELGHSDIRSPEREIPPRRGESNRAPHALRAAGRAARMG